MNCKIFVGIVLFAVLSFDAVVAASSPTSPSTTSTLAPSTSTTTAAAATTTATPPTIGVTSAGPKPTTGATTAESKPTTTGFTTAGTTPKPPICKVGNCSGAVCYNNTGFGTSTPCKSGESCAVIEISETNCAMSCQPTAHCKALEATGTAACCDTDYCIPDLAEAKARAKNGCMSLRMNVGLFLAIMALVLLMVI